MSDSCMYPATMNGAAAGAGAAPEVTAALPPPPRRVYGWKEIAAEIEVAVRTAKKMASRNRDPLPVEYGHRGVWAYASALRDWVRRQNVPYHVHLEQERARAQARTAKARQVLAERKAARR